MQAVKHLQCSVSCKKHPLFIFDLCAQHVLGIFTQFSEHCLWLDESEESSPVDEEEITIKIDDHVDTSLASEGTDLLTCGRCNPVSRTQNDTVISWITLRGNDYSILTWFDLTLAYILDHAVSCVSAASSGQSLHLIISQLRMKNSMSNCQNHVWQTKFSIRKELSCIKLPEVCLANSLPNWEWDLLKCL